jgi:5'-nucleotidase
MRLLVTNDDGIDSVFLRELVLALLAAGHDTCVVAPRREQSWIGAAKSRNRAVASEVADCGFGCPTWAVDGTPADCVNIALAHLLPAAAAPEAVVSGINIGRNASLGFILASGTIGGAWEGALHGLPAIALSHDMTSERFQAVRAAGGRPDAELHTSLRHAAAHAARWVAPLAADTPAHAFWVHNINYPLPTRLDSPVRRTVPALAVPRALFGPAEEDGAHRFVFQLGEDFSPPAPLTDRACLEAGEISYTVLDYTRLGALP